MGVAGLLAALALLRWVPRYSPFATVGTRTRRTTSTPDKSVH
jgi:hypothetical protein